MEHHEAKIEKINKQELRERIWLLLEQTRVARFPLPVKGRIPNFEGAGEAALQLRKLKLWKDATILKSNPDSPQYEVRYYALKEHKTIYMAVPRLRTLECFIKLDPRAIDDLKSAATIKGAFKYGKLVHPTELESIDLIIAGSVAVDSLGGRVGKGGGYSDIEYALLREFGLADDTTPIVTTIHPLQLLHNERILMLSHDIPVDYIITSTEVIATNTIYSKPKGIRWEILERSKLDSIPILQQLQQNIKYKKAISV